MSLLSKVANQEIFDFLKTVTVKSTYFADKFRETQILPTVEKFVPETSNPYTIHLAGEYILDPSDRGNYPSESSYLDSMSEQDGTGYRLTKDTVFKRTKNYFVRNADVFHRLSYEKATEYSDDGLSPVEMGMYELQPLVVKNIIDPITGDTYDHEYSCSNQIFDRDGTVYPEIRNKDLFTSSAFDRLMYVTSLDTGQLIPFTLENLYVDCALAAGLPETSVHTKTLDAYKIPGRYFDLLCERYPTQVDLIKAIVYRVPSQEISSLVTPAEIRRILNDLRAKNQLTDAFIKNLQYRFKTDQDMLKLFGQDLEGLLTSDDMTLSERRRTRISKAKNFTLLHCDTSRLNENERISIKEHVVEILDIISKRWAINEFNFESNYATVLWTMMWSILPTALVAKRYSNIKTPSVSVAHMWNYLSSKGLAKYKGYLTESQTWFLYKNIRYLLDHAGQQKTLNILIDNILSEYGLSLKTKTVVLDTTKSLTEDSKPTVCENQCKTCSRHGTSCFKNITSYLCNDWLGTTNTCKAEPIVLTEEFAGATKQKIIKELIASFGYTEEAAEIKYKRSFIWRDDDVEAIRNDLDRNQMVDQSGKTSSIAETIAIEHENKLEPINNEDVIEEQTDVLRNMNGTVVPTKLLEMSRNSYNTKFAKLFNRFLTESLFRLAPTYGANGKYSHKVTFSYKFDTTEGASEFIFSYGEMLAAAYLAFSREHKVDILIDDLLREAEAGSKPLYEYALDKDGNRIVVGINKETGEEIYLKKLSSWIQHRITDMMYSQDYDFAIPTKCRTTTALKFGRPIIQQELVDTWRYTNDWDHDEYLSMVTNADDNTKILSIRGTLYAATIDTDPDAELWEGFDTKVKVLGSFTTYRVGDGEKFMYNVNNDEIPIIPKYFRWYYTHLNPSVDATEEAKAEMMEEIEIITKYKDGEYVEAPISADSDDDLNNAYKKGGTRKIQTGINLVDPTRGVGYQLYEIGRYIDLDSIVNDWVDMTGMVSEQATIANYIDTSFNMLESIYCLASSSGSARTHLACRKFLDSVIAAKEIHFDLVTTKKTHVVEDGTKVAYFSEWIAPDKELEASFKIIENLTGGSGVSGWNEFSTAIVNEFLKGCTIEYAANVVNDSQFNKLKELVLQLSSYKINIVNDTTTALECITTSALVEEDTIEKMDINERHFFDPIGEGHGLPRVGGYSANMDADGNIFVPTTDLRRVKDKQYYTLSVTKSKVYENVDPNSTEHAVDKPLAKILQLGSGTAIHVGKEYVNVPTTIAWDPYYASKDVYARKGKEYFRYIPETKKYSKVATESLPTVVENDRPIEEDVVTGTDDQGNTVVYSTDNYFEEIYVGDRLPFGKIYEKVNLYELLEITPGTPLLIGKDESHKWFYRTGVVGTKITSVPASLADVDNPLFEQSKDKFDLLNDFSNDANSALFGSEVYRLNVPIEHVVWSDIEYSVKLENVLFLTIASTGIITESTEPSLLILVKDEDGNEGSDLEPSDRNYTEPQS